MVCNENWIELNPTEQGEREGAPEEALIRRILAAGDALVERDCDEAYHQLYEALREMGYSELPRGPFEAAAALLSERDGGGEARELADRIDDELSKWGPFVAEYKRRPLDLLREAAAALGVAPTLVSTMEITEESDEFSDGLARVDPRYLKHLRNIEERAIEEGWTDPVDWEVELPPPTYVIDSAMQDLEPGVYSVQVQDVNIRGNKTVISFKLAE